MLDGRLNKELEKRKSDDAYRSLKTSSSMIDFCSNDYLGFSSKSLHSSLPVGATGSRLISGTKSIHTVVEDQIAVFHNDEAALIFNSGYDANLAFLSTVPKKGDTVIYDQLCHASIRDGLRLGVARNFSFTHNDLRDLKGKISKASGSVFVVVESVYSMDGDAAHLVEIEKICSDSGAYLVVDEAHATGVFGEKGEGLCGELGIEAYARVHTFGKALGVHGAVICGSQVLKEYLVNYARPFIYTTALPPHSIDVISQVYASLENSDERKKLKENIEIFKSNFKNPGLIESDSPIQCVIIGGNEKCKTVAEHLQSEGFDVRPILSPTVEKGKERIRICLHSFNSREEITNLCAQLNKIL